jgi:hypothetical protein
MALRAPISSVLNVMSTSIHFTGSDWARFALFPQAVWNPDWQSTQSSKLAYLKRCLLEMVAQNNALLKGSLSSAGEQSPGQGDVITGRASPADGTSASWQTAVPRQPPVTW